MGMASPQIATEARRGTILQNHTVACRTTYKGILMQDAHAKTRVEAAYTRRASSSAPTSEPVDSSQHKQQTKHQQQHSNKEQQCSI